MVVPQPRRASFFSEIDFLRLGLGYQHQRIGRLSTRSQRKTFKSVYGISPRIMHHVWQHLRLSADPEVVIYSSCKPDYLLLYYRWVKSYDSEEELHAQMGFCVNTISLWCKRLGTKIALLRKTLVRYLVTLLMYLSTNCCFLLNPDRPKLEQRRRFQNWEYRGLYPHTH